MIDQANLNHTTDSHSIDEYPIRLLKFVISRLKIRELFSKHIRDPRSRIDEYDLTFLLMHGLLAHLFRSPSKHDFALNLLRSSTSRAVAEFNGNHNRCPCKRFTASWFLYLPRLQPRTNSPIGAHLSHSNRLCDLLNLSSLKTRTIYFIKERDDDPVYDEADASGFNLHVGPGFISMELLRTATMGNRSPLKCIPESEYKFIFLIEWANTISLCLIGFFRSFLRSNWEGFVRFFPNWERRFTFSTLKKPEIDRSCRKVKRRS